MYSLEPLKKITPGSAKAINLQSTEGKPGVLKTKILETNYETIFTKIKKSERTCDNNVYWVRIGKKNYNKYKAPKIVSQQRKRETKQDRMSLQKGVGHLKIPL